MCDATSTLMVWIWSSGGGRAHSEAFCSEECKRTALQLLAEAGFEEARGVTGRDVFIPMSYRVT